MERSKMDIIREVPNICPLNKEVLFIQGFEHFSNTLQG